MENMSYQDEWKTAIERSKNFGLKTPEFHAESKRYITADFLQRFPYIVRDAIGYPGLDEIVCQCLSIHYRLQPALESHLGCPVHYTIGWVHDGSERGLFRFDDKFIRDKISNPKTTIGGSINIHAWLTLPSMEVIDMSLPTSLAVLQNLEEGRGGVIAAEADSLNGIAYKPMLVGTDFLKKSGFLHEFG